MKEEKVVYIFGAGASRAVGLPMQAQLLYEIFSIQDSDIGNLSDKQGIGIMDVYDVYPLAILSTSYDQFKKSRKILASFLLRNFGNIELALELESMKPGRSETDFTDFYGEVKSLNITLEDVFTIFDKAYILNEYFALYSPNELQEIRSALSNCIIYILEYKTQTANSLSLYDKISESIIAHKLNFIPTKDSLAIITLNWDTLLDQSIYTACSKHNTIINRSGPKIFIDYCFYDYNLNDEIPSTHHKARGDYNIKLLKLHGSINWLQCQNCGRIFTDFTRNISMNSLSMFSDTCKYCKGPYKSVLVTPTFLKDLNHLQLKNIWHNACNNLSNATEVVFIGYSLPEADFEFRYILKKALNPTAKITVVLHSMDNPDLYYKDLAKNTQIIPALKDQFITRLNLPSRRYMNLFGNHSDISIYYDGIEEYFNAT